MAALTGSPYGALVELMPTDAVRARATIVAIAPVVLAIGFLLHPPIGAGPPDHRAVAEAATDHTIRWGVAHLMLAASSALLILAFLSIRVWLRDASRDSWSAWGIPFIVVGSTLYALLPAMEMAPLFAARADVDVEAVADALVPWFVPIHVLGGLAYGVGLVAFAMGLAHSGLLTRRVTRLVVGGLALSAAARFVPLTAIHFYVQSAASIAAFWPLAARSTPLVSESQSRARRLRPQRRADARAHGRRPRPHPVEPSLEHGWVGDRAAVTSTVAGSQARGDR